MANKPENLKPFKKGKDPRRNVTGKNKGSVSITARVKAELEKMPEGEDKRTYADLLVKRIFSKAIKDGDTRMIEKIWAYIDGLPQGSLDLTTMGKSLNISYDNAFTATSTPKENSGKSEKVQSN